MTEEKALVYSCSGCSNVAQIANQVALRLNTEGIAEMSCIAGVGCGIPSFLKTARSRNLVAIDGCGMECCKKCLSQHGLVSDVHIRLDHHDFKKQKNCDFNQEDANRAYDIVIDRIERKN